MLLKDKVSLITGGGRGIGKETALLFAREGSDVIICDIDKVSCEETRREIEALGRKAMDFQADVTSPEQVQEMITKILDNFKKIDILINNAGITRDGLLVRMSESDWDKVLAVNLKGVYNCTKAVAKPMMKKRSGGIVNIASIIGIIGNAGQANYAASKGGIIAFTKSVARELSSRGIRANAIAPGFIDTEMTRKLPDTAREAMLKAIPLNKLGNPLDVAKVALFLASENSSYITGHVINVDGGMVM